MSRITLRKYNKQQTAGHVPAGLLEHSQPRVLHQTLMWSSPMKTVKVSTQRGQYRRVELMEEQGRPAVLCRAGVSARYEYPHPRAGVSKKWIPQGTCGPTDQPMQWWVAAD